MVDSVDLLWCLFMFDWELLVVICIVSVDEVVLLLNCVFDYGVFVVVV